jgi:heat shock protein HtpX
VAAPGAAEARPAVFVYADLIMFNRVFLFVLTNLAVVLTLSIVLSLLGVSGYTGGTTQLAVFCLVWGMGGAIISLLMSRWSAKRMTGMQLVTPENARGDAAWLYQTVERLARQANLPMPEVGVYSSPEVNAFATGPSKNRSLVAVSQGLLQNMRKDEVEGVLAHEVAHIANGDMVTMTLIQGVVNALVMFIARMLAMAIRNAGRDDREGSAAPSYMLVWLFEAVLGVGGMLITAWFSRQREFRADYGGATLAGRDRMLGALRRLASNQGLIDPRHERLATMKISGRQGFAALFSTHPPLEQRIDVLQRAQLER